MKREKGITLIALVVTIVVLIILAAVSISMLTGENGIITQAQNSKEATEQARVEELVDLAVNSLISENQGSTNGITPEMVAQEVNEMENREDVYAEGSTFPTNIIFPEEGRKVAVDLNEKVENDSIYDADVNETDIAPADLFDYEIIDENAKTAKITRIKPIYCNMNGYNPDTDTFDLVNTNGNIVYNGEISFDKLVVPYEVEMDGKMYKIIEVEQLHCKEVKIVHGGTSEYNEFPNNIYMLIFPNTIEKIYTGDIRGANSNYNGMLETVVLSNKLKLIENYAFYNCENLTNITIPSSVTSIGDFAFGGCDSLTSIKIPDSVTSIGNMAFYYCTGLTSIVIPSNVTNIGNDAFWRCSGLTSITIPSSITSIGDGVFRECSGLTSITIPSSITSIGDGAFWDCSKLTNIIIPSSVNNIEGRAFRECSRLTSITIPASVTNIGYYAFYDCDNLTTVNYRGTQEQWNAIAIESGNEDLTNATINYNYTGE